MGSKSSCGGFLPVLICESTYKLFCLGQNVLVFHIFVAIRLDLWGVVHHAIITELFLRCKVEGCYA